MSTIGEIKVHVTACGCEELSHLIAMLEANIAVLPGVVVRAMKALADSGKPEGVEIQPPEIKFGDGVDIDSALQGIVAEFNRASAAHGGR